MAFLVRVPASRDGIPGSRPARSKNELWWCGLQADIFLGIPWDTGIPREFLFPIPQDSHDPWDSRKNVSLYCPSLLVAVVCKLHNVSATGGHTLHNFSIGRITDNSVWFANYISQMQGMQEINKSPHETKVLMQDWISS